MESPNDLFEQGLKAGRMRQYEAALRFFTAWEAQDHPEAWFWIGRSLLGLKRPLEAVMVLQSHINRYPQDSLALFHLGRAYLSLEQYSKAVHCFSEVHRLGKAPLQVSAFLGYTFLKSRKPDAARQWFQEAVRLMPRHAGVYQGYLNSLLVYGISSFRSGRFELCRDVMLFLSENNASGALVRMYLAASLRELGNWEAALTHYQRLRDEHPEDTSLLFHVWECAYRAGHPVTAEDARKRLKTEDPELARGHPETGPVVLAWKLYREKRYRQAIAYALSHLKATGDPSMHLLIGNAYRCLGQTEKAVNHLTRARELLGSQEASYALVQVLWEKNAWAPCRSESLKLLRMAPGNPLGETFRAMSESRLGTPGIDHPQRLLLLAESHSSDALLHRELGLAFLRAGKHSEAQRWLWISLKEEPRDDETIGFLLSLPMDANSLQTWEVVLEHRAKPHLALSAALAELYWKESKYEDARRHILISLKEEAKNPKAWELLARIERDSGRFAESFAVWATILRREAGNRAAILNIYYCLHRMGQEERADTFRYKVLKQTEDRFLHYSFGRALVKLGKPSRAIEEYLELLHFYPGHGPTLAALQEARDWEQRMKENTPSGKHANFKKNFSTR